MFAVLVLNYRLALFFLVVLNLGTAVPLAFGWARVLPEEPPPFGNAEDSFGRIKNMPSADELRSKRRDPFAIVLLLCVTLSYACQFPGLPGDMGFGSIPTVIPYDTGGRFPCFCDSVANFLYAVAAFTCPSAAATSFKSGTTGMS
jgi:hypothetical protein